jgi:hypothetical protein
MRAKVDQFCDWLRDRLNAIEKWLESVKTDIQALPWNARMAHQRKLREARAKLQAQKERVEQTRAELKSPPHLAAELLVESVIGWKVKPDVREPHAGPDAAEAHAEATIDHAVAGIDEVGDAMLSATVARLHDTAK